MTTSVTTGKAPFEHRSGGHTGLPSMEVPGVEAFIGDTLSNPQGSELAAGFFELRAGEPLDYTYTYDEMKVVVEGEFHLTNLDTGDRVVAGVKDVLFFPKGPVPNLCRQGVCGECRVGVLSGRPLHRDFYLSESERAAADSVMCCVSRSESPSLELDL